MQSFQVTEFGAPLVAVDNPTPKPQGAEILLKVVASGVCHSDLHLWEGGYELGHGKRLSLAERGVRLPRTMGHETVGEVIALGPDASGVGIGDIRLIYPWMGCGNCAVCATGAEHYCPSPRYMGIYRDGGYADHVLVPDTRYLIDLNGLDPLTAAPYACSGLTTFSALKKVEDIFPTHPIVIIGAGGLGLMSLSLLSAMGGKGAVVVDIDDRKRQAALEAGALAAIDGRASDVSSQVLQATGGPVHAVIDLVGSEQTATLGFDLLIKGGRLIMVGLFGGAAPWALPLIAMKAATIQGSNVGSIPELRELLQLVKAKNLPPIPVSQLPLESATRTLEQLRDGEIVGRAVLVPACGCSG